jgi:hypothetical protein
MEKLFSVQDMCERYQCKPTTARKYMRDMVHMERPRLMVTERALAEWERRNTLPPESETRRMMRKGVKK